MANLKYAFIQNKSIYKSDWFVSEIEKKKTFAQIWKFKMIKLLKLLVFSS